MYISYDQWIIVVVIRQEEKIAALESTQETQTDNQLIQLRLIDQLREATAQKPPPLQKDRGDILRASSRATVVAGYM